MLRTMWRTSWKATSHARLLARVVIPAFAVERYAKRPTCSERIVSGSVLGADTKRVAVFLGPFRTLAAPVKERLKSEWECIEWSPEEGPDKLEKLLGKQPISAIIGGGPQANELMSKTANLKLLQIPFTGFDWLAKDKIPLGCSVCNVHGMDPPIAEYVMGTMLDWSIGFSTLSREFKTDGIFRPPFPRAGYPARPYHMELSGKTLGIIGYGSIGKEVAKRAVAFDMRIIATAKTKRSEVPAHLSWIGSADSVDLEHLLRESDFVLLSCPLNENTAGMIGPRQLSLMKRTSVLINVARGAIVDEAALWEVLQNHQIAGAILDVWWGSHESGNPSLKGYQWHTIDNVVMTPHSAGWTYAGAAQRKFGDIAANLDALFTDRPLRHRVVPSDA